MARLTVVQHPLIEDCLAYLRDRTTGVSGFRRYARLLTQLLCFEATHDLALQQGSVETPLEGTAVHFLAGQAEGAPNQPGSASRPTSGSPSPWSGGSSRSPS